MKKALLFLLLLTGCSKDSPTQPTPPPPPAVTYSVTGQVTIGTSAVVASGATVRILDGPNGGRSTTTDGQGRYTLSGLPFGSGNMEASGSGYSSSVRVLNMVQGTSGNTVNFSILPNAVFSRTGTGDTVFDVPLWVTRVRIQANFPGNCQNFAMRIGGRLLVNEILGTCSVASGRNFDGSYATSGGQAEVTISTGVNWSVLELR